jgi:hypothetical protein
MKASLVVHPGVAKCATSTIQRFFVVNNYMNARMCGCIWMGKKFKAYNGYSPVSEIMYSKDACIRDIGLLQPDPDLNYILSSEALMDSPAIINALKEKFEIKKAVVTIRMPLLQAISNYCYSGWIGESFDVFINTSKNGIRNNHDYLDRSLIIFQRQITGDVRLCPIEHGDVVSFFCREAFEKPVFTAVDYNQGSSNKSISLNFATALSECLISIENYKSNQVEKRKLIDAVRLHQESEEISSYIPPEMQNLFRNKNFINEQLILYRKMLRKFGQDTIIIENTISKARDILGAWAEYPSYSKTNRDVAIAEASKVIDSVIG